MKQRIITAIILGIVAIPVCMFSGTAVLPIVMAFLGAVGVYELLGCMGTRSDRYISVPLYFLAALMPFFVWSLPMISDYLISVLLLVYALYILAYWVFSYQKDQNVDMNKALASIFVSLYIIGAASSVVFLRNIKGGEYYWYFIFIGAWVTDIFAYFTGMLCGKHKLIPAVSPKKTVEGAIGGTIFCVAFFVGYGAIINHFTDADKSLILLGFAGLLAAIVSQIGDLSMSVIKRTYGLKDYGKIFPGHGGVLDRFDSIFAVAIVLALVLG